MKTIPPSDHRSTGELIRNLKFENHKRLKAGLSSLDVHLRAAYKVDKKGSAEIYVYFRDLKTLLEQHLTKEEKFVYPIIEKIAAAEKGFIADVILVKSPTRELKKEHRKIANLMSQIKEASHCYHASVTSPPSFKEFVREFRNFETDFSQHVSTEETILFHKTDQVLNQLATRSLLSNKKHR